ncbi:MAG: double-stranded uracil-DNA glycosylase [Myxococcaceae bacterium]|nr:double-stranded uracil-DNA glycosylase [Myxococcaceae bacterium]
MTSSRRAPGKSTVDLRSRASSSEAKARAALRPTAAQLQAARECLLPDLIAPDLRVLFVGINPGLYSTALGHHFARPGNRFWPALALARLTPRRFAPSEDAQLLELGLGLTNLVPRTTARADELRPEELIAGAAELERKLVRYRPRVVAILGVTAYRAAFGRRAAKLGRQAERLGPSRVHVLPNPSGLNAHHQLPELARWFAEVAT